MSLIHINIINIPTKDALKTAEKNVIEQALENARYNQSQASKDLGISRGCLRMKLKKYFGDKYIA